MTKFILRLAINAIALYLAVLILPGIDLRSNLVSILWLALIFGLPTPGYVAPQEGPTTEAASRAMSQLAALFAEAHQTGKLRRAIIAPS